MQVRSIYFIILCLLFVACHNRGGAIHTVAKGETVYRISHTYQVNLKDIQKANPRLQVSQIYPGQKILIPGAKENKNVQTFIAKSMQAQSTKKKTKQPQTKKNIQVESSRKNKTMGSKKKLSFIWPYKGLVSASYGKKNGKMHNGIDVQTPSKQNLRAAEKGNVVYAGSSLEGYDKMLILQHGQAVFTVYAYLGEFLVQKGSLVKKGQLIAKTKKSPSSFYHFEIRMQKTALDPMKHLSIQ